MKNTKYQNIAKRAVRFSKIDYGLLQRDLDGIENCHTLEELRATLPDQVTITLDRERYDACKEGVDTDDFSDALFKSFADQTNWLVRQAYVEIPSLNFSGTVSFLGKYTRSRGPASFYSGEIDLDELCRQLEEAGEIFFAHIFRARHSSTKSESSR